MYVKKNPPLIFYWELSKNVLETYFSNMQIDGCFQKEHFCLETFYDMTKVWGYSKRVSLRKGGKVDKKVTKNDVGRGFAAKRM